MGQHFGIRTVSPWGFNLFSISFTHSAPEGTSEYFAFFRCPVEFNADDNRIVLTQEVVDKRLLSTNPQLAQLNDQIMLIGCFE